MRALRISSRLHEDSSGAGGATGNAVWPFPHKAVDPSCFGFLNVTSCAPCKNDGSTVFEAVRNMPLQVLLRSCASWCPASGLIAAFPL
jgi:hypothetical protein